jgi:hypothetical protein
MYAGEKETKGRKHPSVLRVVNNDGVRVRIKSGMRSKRASGLLHSVRSLTGPTRLPFINRDQRHILKMDELVSAKQFLPDRSRSGDFGIAFLGTCYNGDRLYIYPAISIGPYTPTPEEYGIQHAIPSRSKHNSSDSLNGIG